MKGGGLLFDTQRLFVEARGSISASSETDSNYKKYIHARTGIYIHTHSYKMATEGQRGFKQVPDFEKNEAGDFIKPSDPVVFFEAKEQRVRERFINIAQAKMLREEVRQCYYKSGVNHYQ